MIIWKQQAVIKYVEKVREKLSGISIQEEHVQNWFWEGFFPPPKKAAICLQYINSRYSLHTNMKVKWSIIEMNAKP